MDRSATVVAIASTTAAHRRARREVAALVAEAVEHLAVVRAGEFVYVHGAHLALVRAVRIVLDHRLDVEELAS